MGSTYFTKRVLTQFKKEKRQKAPKTFKSVESAENFAKKTGLKEYSLVNLREKGRPKIKILPKK